MRSTNENLLFWEQRIDERIRSATNVITLCEHYGGMEIVSSWLQKYFLNK